MKKQTIAYWVATALTAFVFLSGGIVDVGRFDFAAEGIIELKYPLYIMTILGIWKILGGIVVLLPRLPLLKEWAYAGMTFNLTGAAASHFANGDPLGDVITPLVLWGIVAASWALRPASRRIAGVPSLAQPA
jgi:uncharacterized membrane protein YphA (DoxX/SURF4 family)